MPPPGETSRPYDDQFAVLGNGLVTLTASATITDGDGDRRPTARSSTLAATSGLPTTVRRSM